jgi:hypothetical protein
MPQTMDSSQCKILTISQIIVTEYEDYSKLCVYTWCIIKIQSIRKTHR